MACVKSYNDSRHPYIRGHCRSTTAIGDDLYRLRSIRISLMISRSSIFISGIKYSTRMATNIGNPISTKELINLCNYREMDCVINRGIIVSSPIPTTDR